MKRPSVWKYSKRVLLGIGLIVAIVVVDAALKLLVLNAPPMTAARTQFITANPVNLSQIAGLSKFRSCQGHDFPGKETTGEMNRGLSMKHYVEPLDELKNQLGIIEIKAPFDGKIATAFPGSKGAEIIVAPDVDPKWGVIIFHIDLKDGLKTGSVVKAGQVMGYANVKDRHDFDIGLTRTEEGMFIEQIFKLLKGSPHLLLPGGNYLVSPFEYMTPAVLAEFKAVGINTSNLSYTKEYRKGNPCNFDASYEYRDDWVYIPGRQPKQVQKPAGQQPAEQPSSAITPQVLYP